MTLLKKLALILALAAGAGLAAAQPAPSVKKPQVDTPKKILFVGNSYLYYNDSIHNHFRRMVADGGIATEKQQKIKIVTIGGAPLTHHDVASYLAPGKLGMKEPYDVVILQGNSGAALTDARRKAFHDKVVEFNADIVKTGAKTALYMTHAYVAPNKNASPDMMRKVEDMYVSAGNEVGALVIPVGLAFEEAYRRKPDLQLQKTYDGSHPDLIGSYLAACVVYASLHGKSPVGNTYDYFGKVDKETAAFLQQVAWDTVQKFYGR
jgi:Domain of unknown function (DUF4886)